MPVIRVDGAVWEWLKGQARPFEDTPNSVLRRVAGMEAAAGRATNSNGRGDTPGSDVKTPQHEYRRPLLAILLKHGGKGDRNAVLNELEETMSDRLTDYDRQDIKSGAVRWRKSAEWEVSTMRQEGLILTQAASPRGVWCLSPTGEQLARGGAL